ncbi:MAG: hypothetical protein JW864_03860 [Spirochaetes bacterium]|nr:hypothetical protein [Spirochaetota bacterium]
MRKKYSLLVYTAYLFSICLILFLQPGCTRTELNINNIPEPYVSTGFPQVVVVSGSNYEMGVQYGEQAAPAIFHNLAIFKSKLYNKVKGGEETVAADMHAWNHYLIQHNPTLKEWLDGIKQGCDNMGYTVSYDELILIMVYPTELWSRPADPYPSGIANCDTEKTSEPSMLSYHSCNSFAATGKYTSDGKPLHAITQMAGTEMMDNIILIAFPETGYSFVSQTYAGRVNANNAMNSSGLAWTMTAILTDKPAWGLGEVYFHYLAQLAPSRTEAINYIKNTPRGGVTGGFIFSDAKGIEAFETNSKTYAKRAPAGKDGFLVQTNHLIDPGMVSFNPPWLIHIGTFQRYDTVFQYLKKAGPGSVDFEFARKILSSDDWYEKSKNTWHRNNPGVPFLSNDHTSVSESIFFPADLTAYLATGTPSGNGIPAYAAGEYVKIKLATAPKEVVGQADADALKYYWEAADLFQKEMNTTPPPVYLTQGVMTYVQELLDNSMTAYSIGIDRAAYAFLVKDSKKSNVLWGNALTNFAKAQIEAQMAQTALYRAGTKQKNKKIKEKSFFK